MSLHHEVAMLKRQLEDQKKTLRDEFAMAALTGLLASPRALLNEKGDADVSISNLVSVSNKIADAMLEARK